LSSDVKSSTLQWGFGDWTDLRRADGDAARVGEWHTAGKLGVEVDNAGHAGGILSSSDLYRHVSIGYVLRSNSVVVVKLTACSAG
jgi:membrane-bound ClpP family serine protease